MEDTRFDQFTRSLATRHFARRTANARAQVEVTAPPAAVPGARDALAGRMAPVFTLPDLAGRRIALDVLLAHGKPLLLVFTDPRCGPCYELLPDLGGWQRVYGDRLEIALVSSGEPRTNESMIAGYGIGLVLLQEAYELIEAYGLTQAPAAVLVQPDGRVDAGPRFGTLAIRQLVADTLGLVLPPAPVRESRIAGPGDLAPPLRLPDLHGNVIDLATWRGQPTVLLFWSPGCSHCAALLPTILAYERQPNGPRIVVVSRGPAGLNQELGFASPVVLDESRAIGDALGVTGTPAAVLVDGMGRVAAPVGRGASGVRTLLAGITVSAPTAADWTRHLRTGPRDSMEDRNGADDLAQHERP